LVCVYALGNSGDVCTPCLVFGISTTGSSLRAQEGRRNMNYLWHILFMICLYSVLGLSLNLALGYGGMVSLCHAALYGIGAYAAAMLMLQGGWSFFPSLAAAALLTGVVAWLIAIPATRFRGDSFVLASLAFQMIVFSVLYNWVEFTRGAYGLSGIPKPSGFGITVTGSSGLFILVFFVAASAYLLIRRLVRSPYGRTLQAVRDDEMAAESLGKNVVWFRRTAFVIAGILAGVGGVLYASYAGFIDPTSFGLDESVFILCVVIVGGAGTLHGPIVGAFVLVLLPELLRFLGLPDAVAANVHQIIYGLLLIIMMRFRPQGLVGKYAFD